MVERIDDTLRAKGYAQVLVALKTDAASTAAGARSFEGHFTVPNGPQAAALVAAAERTSTGGRPRPREPRVRVYPNLGLAIGYVDRQGADALGRDDRVSSFDAVPNIGLIHPVQMDVKTPRSRLSWGIKRLKVDRLWEQGMTGKGVLVGHLDTGVDGTHPALAGAIEAFAEFDLTGELVPDAPPRDSGTHGTHTAGTILGRSVDNKQFGVAPDAKLVSGMVIEGGQTITRILSGMEWVVARRVKILSLSLGVRGYTSAFEILTKALRTNGVLPVFAIGNEGPLTSRSPGNYRDVLAVGAMDVQDAVADFSSSEEMNYDDDPIVPDLVAPGANVYSCIPGGRFATMGGTSMATPHIAGLAALLLQAVPNATDRHLEAAILGSCVRPAGMTKERANRGVPDAVKALDIISKSTSASVNVSTKSASPQPAG